MKLKGTICALASSATFGLIPLFALPLIGSGVNSPSILFYRFALAALILLPICLVSRKPIAISKIDLAKIIGLGGLYALTSMLLLLSYGMIPSGMATTIHFLYPVLVAIIMMFFFHERASLTLFIAMAASLAGVAMISWSDGSVNITGIITTLLSVVTYAVYITGVNRSGIGKLDSLILTTYILVTGAIFVGIYALTTTEIKPLPDAIAWKNALLLAIIPTVISNLTLIVAVKHTGSTNTAALGSLEPLTAIGVGVAYFNEAFGVRSFIGLALIIISVIFVIQRKN